MNARDLPLFYTWLGSAGISRYGRR